MTRVHVRLLGPCFKTGRVGRPVLSAADRTLDSLPEKSTAPTTPENPKAADKNPRASSGPTLVPGTGAIKLAGEFRINDRRQQIGTPGLRGKKRPKPFKTADFAPGP